MKKFSLFLLTCVILSCVSTGGDLENSEVITNSAERNTGSGAGFSDVIGHEWKLLKVNINGVNTQYSRDSLNDIFAESFILRFDDRSISGRGAPNLMVSTPYTLGENNAISIITIPTTLMAAIFEPEHLNERDYFLYIQNAYAWQAGSGILEIFSRLDDGREIQLMFGL